MAATAAAPVSKPETMNDAASTPKEIVGSSLRKPLVPNNLPSTVAPRHRVQFTVRTFFGAAFLVSLFAAAAALPAKEAEIAAITFLVWLTFAGLYWVVGGTGPLVALPVATVVLATTWMLSVPFVNYRLQVELWIAVSAAFAWGVLFSLVVVLSRVLLYAGRRLRGGHSCATHSQSPLRVNVEPALSALRLARHVLFTRLFLSVILGIAAVVFMWHPRWVQKILAVVSLVIDLPLAPLIVVVFYPHRPPDSNLVFLLVTAVFYCPLYAGTGWALGLILARMSRPTTADLVKEGEHPSGELPGAEILVPGVGHRPDPSDSPPEPSDRPPAGGD